MGKKKDGIRKLSIITGLIVQFIIIVMFGFTSIGLPRVVYMLIWFACILLVYQSLEAAEE